MRYSTIAIIALSVFFTGCGQNSSEHDHATHDPAQDGGNQELYDEVMRIHDEVMPKMNDLHKAKNSLKTRLAMPGVSESERKQVEGQIARIDSASEAMMVWMHQFEPIPDSAGEEKARAYLEQELEKIKEVRKEILDVLATGVSAN